MHIELKVILDLDTIVCLIRTLLYGENEIHAIQCQPGDLGLGKGNRRVYQTPADLLLLLLGIDDDDDDEAEVECNQSSAAPSAKARS